MNSEKKGKEERKKKEGKRRKERERKEKEEKVITSVIEWHLVGGYSTRVLRDR